MELLARAERRRLRVTGVRAALRPAVDELQRVAQDPGAVYANFYVANDSVLMPEFGDRKADDRAPGILQEQFPDRDVVPVVIDTVASGGGGIHCATHDQPGEPVD
ncbi:agmatine deiminase family protein [Streptomyces sp. 35M1]|uniref:agmatine deiminase family protein n=1 Tax=Streptomyces sp. 35M1 TaxID=3142978 RepID=UPI003990AE0B